jgi:hypothetical protein
MFAYGAYIREVLIIGEIEANIRERYCGLRRRDRDPLDARTGVYPHLQQRETSGNMRPKALLQAITRLIGKIARDVISSRYGLFYALERIKKAGRVAAGYDADRIAEK